MPRRTVILALLGIGVAIASCTSPQPLSLNGLTTTGSTTASGSLTAQSQPATMTTVLVFPSSSPSPEPVVRSVGVSQTSLTLNTPLDPQASGLPAADFPDKATLVGTVYWSNGSFTNDVLWTSSNPNLVGVDSSGDVWSVSPGATGSATITAASRATPDVTAQVSVTVVNNGKVQLDVY